MIQHAGGQPVGLDQVLNPATTQLRPYYGIISLMALGSSVKQILTMLIVSEQDMPPASAFMIALFNTTFNSLNSLLRLGRDITVTCPQHHRVAISPPRRRLLLHRHLGRDDLGASADVLQEGSRQQGQALCRWLVLPRAAHKLWRLYDLAGGLCLHLGRMAMGSRCWLILLLRLCYSGCPGLGQVPRKQSKWSTLSLEQRLMLRSMGMHGRRSRRVCHTV